MNLELSQFIDFSVNKKQNNKKTELFVANQNKNVCYTENKIKKKTKWRNVSILNSFFYYSSTIYSIVY